MVRGLVEEQQGRLGDQRAREQHSPPPSTRKRRHNRVGRQAQPRQHPFDALLERQPSRSSRSCCSRPSVASAEGSVPSATATAAW